MTHNPLQTKTQRGEQQSRVHGRAGNHYCARPWEDWGHIHYVDQPCLPIHMSIFGGRHVFIYTFDPIHTHFPLISPIHYAGRSPLSGLTRRRPLDDSARALLGSTTPDRHPPLSSFCTECPLYFFNTPQPHAFLPPPKARSGFDQTPAF